MTERTEYKDKWTGARVYYDGDCALCRDLVERLAPVLEPRGFSLQPLPVDPSHGASDKMMVVIAADESFGGADAVVEIARRVWWALPLVWFSRVPGGLNLLRRGYRWIAARRHCVNPAPPRRPKALEPQSKKTLSLRNCEASLLDWLPVVLLIFPVLIIRPFLSPWVFMWMMVGALFLGFKLATWMIARRAGLRRGPGWTLSYLILWPGMDAKHFRVESQGGTGILPVHSEPDDDSGHRLEACDTLKHGACGGRASLNLAAGATLFWGVARLIPSQYSLVIGWIGLAGIVLMLHFGFLDLVASIWGVAPIMREPFRARSVTEFWGRRWNVAFPQMAHSLVYRPLRRRFGTGLATLAVFLFSGVLHELVISLPATGGYGLPTVYFVIQGLAVLGENRFARSMTPRSRRISAWIVVAGPAVWLFHPTFIERVVIPMMHAMGAL